MMRPPWINVLILKVDCSLYLTCGTDRGEIYGSYILEYGNKYHIKVKEHK